MIQEEQRWTLESLVDFEQTAAAREPTPAEVRAKVAEAVRGLQGAAARRAGLRVWLEEMGASVAGRRFSTALSLVDGGFSTVAFLVGISAVLGLLDVARAGINVTLFLAILIGGQWLVLLLALGAWTLRRRAAEGFSGVQALAGKLARRLSGGQEMVWWDRLTGSGPAGRAALLWRLARLAQTAGVFFNVGILFGLAGLVLLKHVGFFWETTTESAMREILADGTRFLSMPWSAWWPDAVPGMAVIDASRWEPGTSGALPPGPEAWWEFLLMATLFWGLVPRAILWTVAWRSGRKSLGALDFQARHHRALWREITGTERVEMDEKPLDGVLVLDVGGCGLSEKSLRPFLLRQLRVNPSAWRSVAVLDEGAEKEAARLISSAPAGVVLLAEGWSLSPPRMLDLHRKIREGGGQNAPVKFCVSNVGPGSQPLPPTAEERVEWERFVDSLRDPAAEIYFFENDEDEV